MKKLFAMALAALFVVSTSSLVLAGDVAASANAATGKTTSADTSTNVAAGKTSASATTKTTAKAKKVRVKKTKKVAAKPAVAAPVSK
jgi:hypothetical protein